MRPKGEKHGEKGMSSKILQMEKSDSSVHLIVTLGLQHHLGPVAASARPFQALAGLYPW